MSLSQLVSWVDETSQSNIQDAKDMIKFRLGQMKLVSTEYLRELYKRPETPAWYREIILDEGMRRKELKEKRQAKEEERAKYQAKKAKHKNPSLYKLLEADNYQSIFKVKWQFKNPLPTGDYWLMKKYSRDYPEERNYFNLHHEQVIRNMIKQKGDFGYELFEKGGLKEQGFNGFMYSMKTFNELRRADKISFFAVYLNNILETHVSGEQYSMEIWSWGEFKR